eukprot:s1803_g13.t1
METFQRLLSRNSHLPTVGAMKVSETKVENWTRWAFTEHRDKAVITGFLSTLKALSRRAEFSDGIPIASICSGWGVAEMVIDAINGVLDDVSPDCENSIRRWANAKLGQCPKFLPCVPIRNEVYPCRTISPQNPNQKSFKDRSSSTGCGYHSTKKYIERSPELVFALLENVQAMFFNRKQFGDECPMQIQTEAMRKLSFEAAFSVCVNSSEYGLSQSRSRAWVLYIRETHMKSSLSGECLMGTLKFNAEKLGLSAFLNAEQAHCPDRSAKKARKPTGDGQKWQAAFKRPELGAANMASQDAEVASVLAAARQVHLQRSLDIAWMS